MAELSEGSATQSMQDQFADIKKVVSTADATFEKDMKVAMEAFEKASK